MLLLNANPQASREFLPLTPTGRPHPRQRGQTRPLGHTHACLGLEPPRTGKSQSLLRGPLLVRRERDPRWLPDTKCVSLSLAFRFPVRRPRRWEVKYVPPSNEDGLSAPALAGGAAAVCLAGSGELGGRRENRQYVCLF